MGNSYTSHTWPVWDCYQGHTWVHYWRVSLRLSALNPYGPYMSVPIWAWPYRTNTQEAHIGLLSGPHMGLLLAAHMGLAE